MRKLILISVLALASVTAQAGQTGGLAVAFNEERIESVKPEEPKANVKPEAAKPVKATSTPVKQASASPTQASKPAVRQASTPARQAYTPANRIHARGYENEEAKARRLAALYGVSW